jgi:pSer/pThr/pTyr-binding forkhead associated (FHA) protein
MNFAASRATDEINWVSGMFKIELKLQDLTIKEYRLQDGDNLSIGRLPGNDIVIPDKSVSRLHASITRQRNSLAVWDKGSKNGIVVNGVKVLSAELKNGDVVRIGAKHHLKTTLSSPNQRESTLTGESNLLVHNGANSLDVRLEWHKNRENAWWTLAEANVEDEDFDDLEGIYIIWYEDQIRVTLRVGQGHIRDGLVGERNTEDIWRYAQQHEIYVTWAKVDRKYHENVARYIAETVKPELKSSYLDVGPFVVNLPWHDRKLSPG